MLIIEHKDIYTNCLAFQLTQARKKVFTWYDSYLKPLGLTPSYVYVLGVLCDVESASPSEIGNFLELERPTVTTLLGRMEQSGLIQKMSNPNNRRETIVRITNVGKAACEQAYPLLVRADEELNLMLDGEFRQLKEQITHLNRRLRRTNP